MVITLKTSPDQKVIELGGGARPLVRPNVDVRQCWDEQGNPTVDFQADFEKPLPIQSEEWDGVFQHFALEHISFPKVPDFLKEVLRILRPGGKFICVTANTAAQLEWMAKNPNGWDGKDYYTAASEILFGSQTYNENTHRNFFNPEILTRLFQEAGFVDVTTTPYGTRDTDLAIQAIKPNVFGTNASRKEVIDFLQDTEKENERLSQLIDPAQQVLQQFKDKIAAMPREQLFDKYYFDRGTRVGGYRDMYMDYPRNWAVFRHVMDYRPESVLELGASRGYILKRLQDQAGIRVCGLDISKHCWLTRAVEDIFIHDICRTPWPVPDQSYDLCLSHDVLQHIPEQFLPVIFAEMKRTCKRGLHGIWFEDTIDDFDKTICLKKSRDWWQQQFQAVELWGIHGLFAKEELEQGQIPLDVIKGDGKCKLNLGCFMTMHHFGWINIDQHDLNGFAQQYQYRFQQHNIQQGLPFATGTVDLVLMSHFLEHLSAREGLACLRDCRRILKPDGAIRIICPDAKLLASKYLKETLDDFSEISDGVQDSPTQSGKLWETLFCGHQMAYDEQALCHTLKEAGFEPKPTHFRKTKAGPAGEQILRETLDMGVSLSVFCDGIPLLA